MRPCCETQARVYLTPIQVNVTAAQAIHTSIKGNSFTQPMLIPTLTKESLHIALGTTINLPSARDTAGKQQWGAYLHGNAWCVYHEHGWHVGPTTPPPPPPTPRTKNSPPPCTIRPHAHMPTCHVLYNEIHYDGQKMLAM